jgi:hypothetical protein
MSQYQLAIARNGHNYLLKGVGQFSVVTVGQFWVVIQS